MAHVRGTVSSQSNYSGAKTTPVWIPQSKLNFVRESQDSAGRPIGVKSLKKDWSRYAPVSGNPLGREVASLDRKRLGQDRWRGQKTGSEAFSIRRLGGSRLARWTRAYGI